MTYEKLGLRLPEIGRVKIGQKGEKKTSRYGKEFQQPEKLDHFKIVTLGRGDDNNFEVDTRAHEVYGEKPKSLIVRPISSSLEENIQAGFALYSASGARICFGDGQTGNQIDNQTGEVTARTCPCQEYEENRCKKYAKASFFLEKVGGIGGVHTMTIRGKITVPALIGSLKYLTEICDQAGGSIAGVPLDLRLNEVLTKHGKVYSPYFLYAGTVDELVAAAKKAVNTKFRVLAEESDEADDTEGEDYDFETDSAPETKTPAATAPSTDSKDQKDPKDQKETKDAKEPKEPKEPKAAKKPESRPAEQPASKTAAQPQTETAKPTTPAAPAAQQKSEVAAGQQSGIEAPKADAPKTEAPKADAQKADAPKTESDNQGQSAGDKDGGKNGVAAIEPQSGGEKNPLKAFWCDSCHRIANEYGRPGTCKCGSNIWHEAANMKTAQEAIAKKSNGNKPARTFVFWCQNCHFAVESGLKPENCNCDKPHWHTAINMEAANKAIEALTGKIPGEQLAESSANWQQNVDFISSGIKRVFGSSTGPAICKQISLLIDRNISSSADLSHEEVEELIELMGVITEMPKNDRDAFITEWKRGRAERLAAEMGANA